MEEICSAIITVLAAAFGALVGYVAQRKMEQQKNKRDDFLAFFRAYAAFTSELSDNRENSSANRYSLIATIQALRLSLKKSDWKVLRKMYDLLLVNEIDTKSLAAAFDEIVDLGHRRLFSERKYRKQEQNGKQNRRTKN